MDPFDLRGDRLDQCQDLDATSWNALIFIWSTRYRHNRHPTRRWVCSAMGCSWNIRFTYKGGGMKNHSTHDSDWANVLQAVDISNRWRRMELLRGPIHKVYRDSILKTYCRVRNGQPISNHWLVRLFFLPFVRFMLPRFSYGDVFRAMNTIETIEMLFPTRYKTWYPESYSAINLLSNLFTCAFNPDEISPFSRR